MTHSPPIPPHNQSPYPLQEPPHEHHEPLPEAAAAEETPAISTRALGIGAVVGIGSAAIVAGLLYARSGTDAAKPKPTRKPRVATSKATTAKPARKTAAKAAGKTPAKTVRKPAVRRVSAAKA
ncbi:hypothetical protein G4G27_15345 [Sphingomonas sp. So64.6b]|uniref:hypothetical protein n=1 Tax=Sphingomonas sp. So64.6b TaxID=2997354 RepID=UPI0016045CA7|nr:hypothetical protein [Sphingomonas sp. So64.6b]QNA85220.1 hypothetical protein G4G27_15345 [Sphingomonas sp. So64.6b]